MTREEMKLELRERLLELPYSKKVNRDQIVARCVFCGDSRRHSNGAHLYIKISEKEDEPILFNCFLCNMGGVLTPQLLKEFEIRDLQLSSNLLSYNNKAMKEMNKSLGVKNNNIELKVPAYKNESDKIRLKKEYIENRLGIEFTYEDLYRLKTIFNLKDLLRFNELKPTKKPDDMDLLDNNYVGFLSCKNEFVICRNTVNDKNRRYDKYSIFKSLENTRKFYTILNTIDLLSTEKIEIHIAEGVFDILGIYHHFHNKDKANKVFAAVCGSGYMNVLKYLIKIGIFGSNVDINIYSDSDKTEHYYVPIKKELSPFVNKINLFHNAIGKDYGVKKEEIRLMKKKL
jgi:hypothetical protein